MKIEKKRLVKIPYVSEEFYGKFFIKDIDGLLLNTIKVYGYMPNERNKMVECPFHIDKHINIIPILTPEIYFDRFILTGIRVIDADVVKIDADKYLHIGVDMNDNYEFVLKNDSNVQEI